MSLTANVPWAKIIFPLSLLSTNKIDKILRKQSGKNGTFHIVHIMYKSKKDLKEKETHYWMF
jgi:hypothetical protein